LYDRLSIKALGGAVMDILKAIITVIYVIICIALVTVVLMQEGKSAGLSGSINGVADTYWGRNRGRSMEGALEKFTRILTVGFVVLSVVLNLI
jgi:preprotein translocase subunit SecG